MDFGDKLKCLREEKGLTRHDFAKQLNISYSAVSKYETNVRFPDKDTLNKIANFFCVSLDYLLGRTDARNTLCEVNANYSLDFSGLPEEAIKHVEEYIEFMRKKYHSDERNKGKK